MRKVLCVIFLAILLCFTFACQNKAEKAELEKFRSQAKLEEQNKEVFRRIAEEFTKGDFEFLSEANAPDYAYFSPDTLPKSMSNAEVIALVKRLREGFPDLTYNIVESVAVGDMVISRIILRGTHKGTYQGIPPTGNKVESSIMNWCKFRDGKVVVEREEFDNLGFMQQLGMELKPKQVKK